ncbi:kinesin-like protein KIF2A [Aphomia sociella]
MDDGTVKIQSGININIKRTDGRIHSAIVSGVNQETRSVTVEWYERGETKGKEVEIDAIVALNPELAIGPRHHTPHLQPMPNKLARFCVCKHMPIVACRGGLYQTMIDALTTFQLVWVRLTRAGHRVASIFHAQPC